MVAKKPKKIEKPAGKIDYDRLKKKIDLINLCADFYLMNEMKRIADLESEGGKAFLRSRESFIENLAATYTEIIAELEAIFLAYFPLAVASELRNKDEIKAPEKKLEKIAGGLLGKIPENDDDLLAYAEREIPDCPSAIGFFSNAKTIFSKLKWEGGYGGKKWADIANTAHMRLSGEIDAIIFIDTAFNIEHHGGHIFDKHQNIRCDTDQLRAVLTIKRDATLPRMEKLIGKKFVSSDVKKLFSIGTKFNWWKSEENDDKEK